MAEYNRKVDVIAMLSLEREIFMRTSSHREPFSFVANQEDGAKADL